MMADATTAAINKLRVGNRVGNLAARLVLSGWFGSVEPESVELDEAYGLAVGSFSGSWAGTVTTLDNEREEQVRDGRQREQTLAYSGGGAAQWTEPVKFLSEGLRAMACEQIPPIRARSFAPV